MELLAKLTQTPSVPGREDRIRAVIQEHVTEAGLFDELRVDAMGSLIGVRKPRPASGKPEAEPQRVMLAAHMDQIGFLVSYVSEDGFVRVNPVGGFDRRNLFARRVRVCTSQGDLPGVMNPSGRPIHIAKEDEKNKIPEMAEFFIDLGLPGEEVNRRVKIGDMVGPDSRAGTVAASQLRESRGLDGPRRTRPPRRAACRLQHQARHRHLLRYHAVLQAAGGARRRTGDRAGGRRVSQDHGLIDHCRPGVDRAA